MKYSLSFSKSIYDGRDCIVAWSHIPLARSSSYRELENLVDYFENKYGECNDADSYKITMTGDKWGHRLHEDPDCPEKPVFDLFDNNDDCPF